MTDLMRGRRDVEFPEGNPTLGANVEISSEPGEINVRCTLKNKGASKGSSSNAIEEPFCCSTKNHSVKGSLKNISFLPFYNLKNLLSPQSFCETERFFRF